MVNHFKITVLNVHINISLKKKEKDESDVESAETDSERIYSSIGETYSTVNLNPTKSINLTTKPSAYTTVY